jgi:TatD DNase family protein
VIVDSHCHLNYPQFADLEAVLARAAEQGVRVCQTISCKRSEFADVKAIADAHENVWCSIGIHPHEAEHHQDMTVEELLRESSHPKVIGLGESGLDYFYEHSPRKEQQACFRTHIQAAQESGLPLIVHSRDADEDTVAILQEMYADKPFKGLIHCFSTGKYLADKAIEIGFMVSLSGIITFKKSTELCETVAQLPIEHLLVETDAPYLAPMPHRGKDNEPAYTRYTLEKLAELKGLSADEAEHITTENFFRLFSKAKRPS